MTTLRQLLDRVVELLGVGAGALEDGEQRLMALGVLLLTVLGLLRVDRGLALQRRVDVTLLRLGVGDVQRGERLAHGITIGGRAPQLAQEVFEPTVIIEDEVDDVT